MKMLWLKGCNEQVDILKRLWSKGCNEQVGVYITSAMQLQIGIGPAYEAWLFDTISNHHNLHKLNYILLWCAHSYEID